MIFGIIPIAVPPRKWRNFILETPAAKLTSIAGPVGTSRTTRLVINPFFLTAAESFWIKFASNFRRRSAPIKWPIPNPNIAAAKLPIQARHPPSQGPKANGRPAGGMLIVLSPVGLAVIWGKRTRRERTKREGNGIGGKRKEWKGKKGNGKERKEREWRVIERNGLERKGMEGRMEGNGKTGNGRE